MVTQENEISPRLFHPNMKIIRCTQNDIVDILEIYRLATSYQKRKFDIHWPVFDEQLIKTEIADSHMWKLMLQDRIACIWSACFSDPQIWEERNSDPSVYIHRIATHPDFRGQQLTGRIIQWAKRYAKLHHKDFIRMDTVGNNIGLIQYYQKYGFEFLGLFTLPDTSGLPAHYQKGPVSLFQLRI